MNKFLIAAALIGAASCVPQRKFEDEVKKRQKAETTLENCNTEKKKLQGDQAALNEEQAKLRKEREILVKDTSNLGSSLRQYMMLDEQNKKRMEELSKTNDRILNANLNENQRLQARIDEQKQELAQQKAELEKLRQELSAKEKNLNVLAAQNEDTRRKLEEREAKVQELQDILDRKDSIVNALQNKVAAALTGFKGSGLEVIQKNGKVYVSLSEQLLFKSGSREIDPKGREAIVKLAKVLETNQDINIAVEGHTDDVPYTGSGQVKDNWDLSVLRATTITRILTEGTSIDPNRITASGRGQFSPVDPAKSEAARKLNRRTEIILTPKLDDLFKIIEGN
ncbi:MAG: OmpA family protein [Bacteroidia bacterium]